MEKKILIIEDEKELATILGSYLKVEGFSSVTAFDGEQGLKQFLQEPADLVLLDIMLPIMNGVEVCKRIRETSDVPIIMISAKDGEMDKVIALGVGADDYVTKPFSPLELVARVKAQLRRYDNSLSRNEEKGKRLQIGRLILDVEAYKADIDSKPVELTTKEFEILVFMARNPGRVYTKEQIYQGVWGTDVLDENTVSVYINRIRDKMKPFHMNCISTVWGVGYKISGEAV